MPNDTTESITQGSARKVLVLVAAVMQLVQAQDAPTGAAEGRDAVIERLSNEVVFNEDGTRSREQIGRIRMESESAVKEFGVLSFPYRNDVERVEAIEIRVHKANGATVETPASNI